MLEKFNFELCHIERISTIFIYILKNILENECQDKNQR